MKLPESECGESYITANDLERLEFALQQTTSFLEEAVDFEESLSSLQNSCHVWKEMVEDQQGKLLKQKKILTEVHELQTMMAVVDEVIRSESMIKSLVEQRQFDMASEVLRGIMKKINEHGLDRIKGMKELVDDLGEFQVAIQKLLRSQI